MTKIDSADKNPKIVKKPGSPFSSDPYNNRAGGKGGNRNVVIGGSAAPKMKPTNVKSKFKGGSGGDR